MRRTVWLEMFWREADRRGVTRADLREAGIDPAVYYEEGYRPDAAVTDARESIAAELGDSSRPSPEVV